MSLDQEVEGKAKKKLKKKKAKKPAEQAAVPQEKESLSKAEPETPVLKKVAKKKAGKKAAARQEAAVTAKEAKEDTSSEEEEIIVVAPKRKSITSNSNEAVVKEPAAKKQKAADGALTAAAFREAHEIKVFSQCPDPVQSFAKIRDGLGCSLTDTLEKSYDTPTPIQAQAWPIALLGRDLVGIAKTGSGKTCAFLLPALARILERGPQPEPKRIDHRFTEPCEPTCLVMAPTRELAQQIAAEAKRFAPRAGAKVVQLFGGVPKGDQIRNCKGGADVLIATPGRLIDLSRGQPDLEQPLPPCVSLAKVNYLVLDEADKMLDMGFEHDIRAITNMCLPSGDPQEGGGAPAPDGGTKRQTLFFTATWPKEVRSIAESLTSYAAVQIRIGQGAGTDKLTVNKAVKQTVEVIEQERKTRRVFKVIDKELLEGETGIIFMAYKAACNQLEKDLRDLGDTNLWARAIHSGKEQWERDKTLANFRAITAEEGGSRRALLIATDVAARGLDIPGVSLVIVHDFGRCLKTGGKMGGIESYVHRIGRTGRAGKTGKAYTFYTSEDLGANELISLLKDAGQEEAVTKQLQEMANKEQGERDQRESRSTYYNGGYGRLHGSDAGTYRSKGGGKGNKGKGKGKKPAGGRGRLTT